MKVILAWLSSFLAKLIPELIGNLGDKEKINVVKKTNYNKTGALSPRTLDNSELLAQLRKSRDKNG